MVKTKVPTIKNLIAAMPAHGINSQKDGLITYASLSFYFDGVDMKGAKVPAIVRKQQQIDESCPINEYSIDETDNGDSYTLSITDVGEFVFNVPTLNTMPELKAETLTHSINSAIKNLANNPDDVMALSYRYFEAVVETLGKLIGLV